MAALKNFGGGVIVISHDERFLTTVSKDVRSYLLHISTFLTILNSYGSALMDPCTNTREMCRHTR
jgi:ATPase subunit of ABC transporter with duplicated ATPase domains